VRIEKKNGLSDRGRSDIRQIVADLILED